jgi:CopG family transcriptional regulator/antitoxin EndoAI
MPSVSRSHHATNVKPSLREQQVSLRTLDNFRYYEVIPMRTTKVLSVTLPDRMLAEMRKLAKKEHRTMSELVREALREYKRERYWREVNAYGRATAEAAGVHNEEDVVRVIKEFRREQRAKRESGSA